MRFIRQCLAIITVALLALGYVASVYSSVTGDGAAYAARVDVPAVKFVALLLLVALIIFAIIPDREEPSS